MSSNNIFMEELNKSEEIPEEEMQAYAAGLHEGYESGKIHGYKECMNKTMCILDVTKDQVLSEGRINKAKLNMVNEIILDVLSVLRLGLEELEEL